MLEFLQNNGVWVILGVLLLVLLVRTARRRTRPECDQVQTQEASTGTKDDTGHRHSGCC